jgi:hypothetical protein
MQEAAGYNKPQSQLSSMGWKTILKPSLVKIVLALLLFALPVLLLGLPSPGTLGGGPRYIGFPVPFMGNGQEEGESFFSWPALAADFVFWYIVSCMIAGALKKGK